MCSNHKTVSAALIVSAALCLMPGCHTPLAHTAAGTFETDDVPKRVVVAREGAWKQVGLYLPNRLVDTVDMVHVALGLGAGTGLDIRLTKWCQLAAVAGAGAGVAWDGRDHSPLIYAAFASAAFGPWRTGVGVGETMSIRPWEIGFGGTGGKIAVDLAEVVDFLAGWVFLDPLEDDYGWTVEGA